MLGRDLIQSLGLCSDIHKVSRGITFKKGFPELFSVGLACSQGKKFTNEVNPRVPPKFCKPHTVPYTIRGKVDKELDGLQEGYGRES